MSDQALQDSVYARWNAAGLDTTIGSLWLAGEGNASRRNEAGAPVGVSLPRAEFWVTTAPPNNKSRGSRTYQAMAVLQVWTDGDSTQSATRYASQYKQNIWDNFVNADEASMTMSGGTILEVDDGGGMAHKVDDNMALAEQRIVIRYRVANTAPAS